MRVSMIQREIPNGQTRERIASLRGNRELEVPRRWIGERTSIAPVRRFPRKKAWFGRWRRRARRRNFGVRCKATIGITWIAACVYVLIKRGLMEGAFKKVDFGIVCRHGDLKTQRESPILRRRTAKRPPKRRHGARKAREKRSCWKIRQSGSDGEGGWKERGKLRGMERGKRGKGAGKSRNLWRLEWSE